jgi:lipopolysaccharide export system permease protein
LIRDLNRFPVLDLHSHTCPFKNKRLNMAAGIIFPVGVFLVFRVARFRIRLLRDLRNIVRTCSVQKERCLALAAGKKMV